MGAPGCSLLWGVGYLHRQSQVCSRELADAKRHARVMFLYLCSPSRVADTLLSQGKLHIQRKKIFPTPLPSCFYNFQTIKVTWVSKPLGKHTQALTSLPVPTAELHPQGLSSPWRLTQGASISCCPTYHPCCIRAPN